jgi:hypothetical protein
LRAVDFAVEGLRGVRVVGIVVSYPFCAATKRSALSLRCFAALRVEVGSVR